MSWPLLITTTIATLPGQAGPSQVTGDRLHLNIHEVRVENTASKQHSLLGRTVQLNKKCIPASDI